MKKLIAYMTVVAAVILFTGCSKSDEKMSAQEFARLLTSTTWAGTHQSQHRSVGSWSSNAPQNVVIYFERSNANAISGTGYQLEFKSSSYTEDQFERKSAITWEIQGENFVINYAEGWDKSYMKYTDDECHLNSSSFSGILYTDSEHRFLYNYVKSNFNEWSKYTNK